MTPDRRRVATNGAMAQKALGSRAQASKRRALRGEHETPDGVAGIWGTKSTWGRAGTLKRIPIKLNRSFKKPNQDAL